MGSCSGIIRRISAASRQCVPGRSRWFTTESAPRTPWLMLSAPSASGGYSFYSVAEDKVISIDKRGPSSSQSQVVGSSHGWLAYFNRVGDGELFLWDPLSGRDIKLARIDGLPECSSQFNEGRASVRKLIMSHPPDDEECIAVAIYGDGCNLALCRPGRSGWSRIPGERCVLEYGEWWSRHYEEMVYSASRALLFCSTRNEDLEAWDLSGCDPRLVWKANMGDLEQKEYECVRELGVQVATHLVYAEQSNQLLVLTRRVMTGVDPDGLYMSVGGHSYPYRTMSFYVDWVDWERGRARRMGGTLGGLSLFVGLNHSMAIPNELKLKGDCVYYTDDITLTPKSPPYDHYKYGGHDIGVFDCGLETISPCYYPCHIPSIKKLLPAPLWFTPSLASQ